MSTPNIDIQQPQPFDIVGRKILIAGNAVAFEGTLTINVTEGHDEYSSFTDVGALALRQFQGSITIPDDNNFKLTRLFLRLADDTGSEFGPAVTIPVLFGPKILSGYTGYRNYTVVSGDTLTGIAQSQYGTSDYAPILAANQHIISDPNLIIVGQTLRIPRNDT